MSQENNNEFEFRPSCESGVPELACAIYLPLPDEIKKPNFFRKGQEVEPKVWADIILEYKGVEHFLNYDYFLQQLCLERGE